MMWYCSKWETKLLQSWPANKEPGFRHQMVVFLFLLMFLYHMAHVLTSKKRIYAEKTRPIWNNRMWPQIISFGNLLPFRMRNTNYKTYTPRTESFPLIYCLLCVIRWKIRKSSCEDFHIQSQSRSIFGNCVVLCCYLWMFFPFCVLSTFTPHFLW